LNEQKNKEMKKISLLVVLAMFVSITSIAQTHAKKGKYSFLKGEKTINLSFDYSNMTVGKNLTEDEYVNQKVTDHNKKEAGKGDKWKEAWEGAREKRYEPKFETLINKSMAKAGIKASQGADAKYTLIVKTVYTEPGFNIGIMKQAAYVNFEMIFIEAESKKEVAKYVLTKIPGSQAMGYDYDAGSRIAESYAKAGKMMGAYIYKGLK
jgi:hypothetical protein